LSLGSLDVPIPTAKHSPDQCSTANELLELVGEKWTVRVVWTLWARNRRFSEIRREIPQISQRMLTLTLRTLERDGLVIRHVTPSIPPRVDYELTDLGKSLGERIRPLAEWAFENKAAVDAARKRFDARTQAALAET
jgi:DNA-binding HxlR family transcriptional regulator